MVLENVRNYCDKNKLSVSAFEKKCGLSNGTVGKWDERTMPTLDTMEKISNATKIPIEKWLK